MPSDSDCVAFLQWALPQLNLRWPGFRRVRQRARKKLAQRLRELGLADLDAYRAYLADHDDEWVELDERCRIVVSRFYRDRGAFDRLRDVVLPRLAADARRAGRAHVDVWSVGCACGEEPWTLRVLWDRDVGPCEPGVDLRVLATDVDRRVLARARRAEYPASSLRSAPRDWCAAVFAVSGRMFRLEDAYRHGVTFVCQDVRAAMPVGPFDLVLCRNLAFTYFDDRAQREVLGQLLARLQPGGWLVVGSGERLPDGDWELTPLDERVPPGPIWRAEAPR